jgi:hypothetical protein
METKHLIAGLCFLSAACAALLAGAAQRADKTRIVREDIEWLDVWLPDSNAKGLPRVLLIGDSITRAYYPEVQAKLNGKAYVGRLTTSKSVGDPALLTEVSAILSECPFDIIHFNNGMHGFGYTEAEYQRDFPKLLATLKKNAPHARLIWATTTPVRQGSGMEEFHPRTNRIRERNRVANGFAAKQGIPVDDLFALVEDHPEYYVGSDGTHLAAKGVSAQAAQVADQILKLMSEKTP